MKMRSIGGAAALALALLASVACAGDSSRGRAAASENKPAAKKDDKKPAEATTQLDKKIARDLDYDQVRMERIVKEVLQQKQQEVNDEIARRQKEYRDAILDIENHYPVKLYDDKWVRCCDNFDPDTGVVMRGAYRPPTQ